MPDTAASINKYVPSEDRSVVVAISTPSQNLAANAAMISPNGNMEPDSITVFATGSTMKRVRLAMNTPPAMPTSAPTIQMMTDDHPASGSNTRCAMPQPAKMSGTMASFESGAVPLAVHGLEPARQQYDEQHPDPDWRALNGCGE
jgi:hypothetical protein